MEKIKVERGQVWQDNDSRYRQASRPRRIAVVTVGASDAVVENLATKRRTFVALKRFAPTSNGYLLIADSLYAYEKATKSDAVDPVDGVVTK